jgi:hydroxyethylthiazole kinase-like uncharacterized protein yjeF
MKIFSAQQIRQWDAYTIMHEPVLSIDLMERAAQECCLWILQHYNQAKHFTLFCGAGNNGGDGLALARQLSEAGKDITVFILAEGKRTDDFIANLERLAESNIGYQFITTDNPLPILTHNTIVIDALFGTGLNKPIDNLAAQLVLHLNQSGSIIISIDMPSGLFADKTSSGNPIIKATHTLSFQSKKLAFILPENASYIGQVHILPIGLGSEFYNQTASPFSIIDSTLINSIYKPRNNFSHKYDYGHALLYAGSKHMMGAAILCAKATLRSGAGLVTVHTDTGFEAVIHSSIPEVISSAESDIETAIRKKNAIAIGPGLEASEMNSDLLKYLILHYTGPLVIDATALILLAKFPEYLSHRKKNPAVLTPHTGEFEKLFGKTDNDFERMELAMHKAFALNCYILLKGHYTLVATPDGKVFFNSTGNPGMATAGSGDTLTGIITGLLAQGYTQEEACLLGVFLHGLAGDFAAEKFSQEAMIAGDIIDCLGESFKKIQQ